MEIKLPNLGDGIDSAVVLSILVKAGDTITKDHTILELETDKAIAPIPSPAAGVVSAIHTSVGDTVRMGTLVLTLSGGSPSAPQEQSPPPQSTQPQAHHAAATPPMIVPTSLTGIYQSDGSGPEPSTSATIKKLAHLFGVDLRRIRGTGIGGRVTNDDVRAYISHIQFAAFQSPAPATPAAPVAPEKKSTPLPDFSKFGDIETKPLTTLRKKIGQKMADSWTTVPHVTQFDEADMTHLMGLRKRYVETFEKKGIKLTVTALILKAVADALKKFPIFNSTLDEENGQIIFKNYYNLGIAVDTENGLIVPVLKNVDTKTIVEVCKDLATIAEKARNRQVALEDLQGSTFTISNLGSLGVGAFTPIVNTPEVGILGLSKAVTKPIAINGEVEIRSLLPLSLSYDHRIIDGADGARFIREIVSGIENFNEDYLKG
ncbi:branched-chain alpha-keto acid dehydrogenase subunit E2 [bacterium]|nr:branched-chain alpha-keto acid dehydrogenase subunit E2 [bacterium]